MTSEKIITKPPNPKQFLKRGDRWSEITSKISKPRGKDEGRTSLGNDLPAINQYDEEDIVRMYKAKKNFMPVFESSDEVQNGNFPANHPTNINDHEETELQIEGDTGLVGENIEEEEEAHPQLSHPIQQKSHVSIVQNSRNLQLQARGKPTLQRGFSGRMLAMDDLETTTHTELDETTDDISSLDESFTSQVVHDPNEVVKHVEEEEEVVESSNNANLRRSEKSQHQLETKEKHNLMLIETKRERIIKPILDSNLFPPPTSPSRPESAKRSRIPSSRVHTTRDEHSSNQKMEEVHEDGAQHLSKPFLSHVNTNMPTSVPISNQRRPLSGRIHNSDVNRPLESPTDRHPSIPPTFGISVPIHNGLPPQSRPGSQSETPGTPSMYGRHFHFDPTSYTNTPYENAYTNVHQQHFDYVSPYNNVPYAPPHISQHGPPPPMHLYARPPTFDSRHLPNHDVDYIESYHPEGYPKQHHISTPSSATSRGKSTKREDTDSDSDNQEENLMQRRRRRKLEKQEQKQKEDARQIQEQLRNLKKEKDAFKKEREKLENDKEEFQRKREEHKRRIENKLSTIRKEKESLEQQRREMEDLQDRQKNFESREISKFKDEVASLNRKIQEDVASHNNEVEKLKKELDNEIQMNKELSDKNKELSSKITQVKQNLSNAENTISKLKADKQMLESKLRSQFVLDQKSMPSHDNGSYAKPKVISNIPSEKTNHYLGYNNEKQLHKEMTDSEDDDFTYQDHHKIINKYTNAQQGSYNTRYRNENDSYADEDDSVEDSYNFVNSYSANYRSPVENRQNPNRDVNKRGWEEDYVDQFDEDPNSELDNNEDEYENDSQNLEHDYDEEDPEEVGEIEDLDEQYMTQNSYKVAPAMKRKATPTSSKIKKYMEELQERFAVTGNEIVPEEKPSKLLKTIELENGKYEEVYTSGVRHVIYPNGTVKKMFPNGFNIVLFDNGDIKRTFPSEKVIYFYHGVRTTHTSYPNKLEVFEFGNGQTEYHYPEGSKYICFPDETRKYILSSGHEEIHFPDGTIQMTLSNGEKSVRFPDGHVEYYGADGSKVDE